MGISPKMYVTTTDSSFKGESVVATYIFGFFEQMFSKWLCHRFVWIVIPEMIVLQ